MTGNDNDVVRRQHLVSRVILKQWVVEGALTAFNLRSGAKRPRSPKAEGFERDFIKFGSAEIEQFWSRFEDRSHAALEAVKSGTCFDDRAHVDALKGLIGLHLVRSRASTVMWGKALRRQVEEGQSSHVAGLIGLLREPGALDAVFQHRTGLVGAGPEAREIARRQLAKELDRRLGIGGEGFAESLRDNLEQFMTDYAETGLEVGVSATELLIGDIPALPVDHQTRRVGLLAGVTLNAADTLFLPVTPRHVIALGGDNTYRDLPMATSGTLNHLQAIAALEKVYLRPGTDLIDVARAEYERRSACRP